MNAERTLIVGGYGHVGSRIARELCVRGRSVVLAGRDGARAARLAAPLGASGVAIDLGRPSTWADALEQVTTVVVCVDQTDEAFARAVLESGRDYVDITASDALFRRIEALDAIAKAASSTAVLSVGLAPGLTNLLVRDLGTELDRPDRARIGVRLGTGDAHGNAATEWLLRELACLPGAIRLTRMRFDPARPAVLAGPFSFADQHVVRRTLGLEECTTFLALEPAWLTSLLFRLRRLLTLAPVRRLLLRLLPRLRFGSDRCAVAVEVEGMNGTAQTLVRGGFRGREEANVTAQVAIGVVTLLDRARRPGVFHVEHLFELRDLAPFAESTGGRFWREPIGVGP